MFQPDERLERQMNRGLDGHLSPDEQRELDRALLRSPQDQEAYRQLQRVDDAAAFVLQSLIPRQQPVRTLLLPPRPSPSRFAFRSPWVPIGLAAAAVLALIVGPRLLQPSDATRPPVTQGRSEPGLPGSPADGGVIRQASAHADRNRPLTRVAGPRLDRRVDRDWIAVRGADGNIYWLEVDRQRTFEQPGSRDGSIRLVGGGL